MTTSATLDYARGDASGLSMPAQTGALLAAGPQFLTAAFRAFGVLKADNAVREILRVVPCTGGSTGEKCFLSLVYEKADPALHTELFVKFSRDFTNPVRDARGKHEMLGEVRMARYSSRHPLPVAVPKAYFADYDAASHTGLLVTETVPFGRAGIEKQHLKCMDHALADPIAYYRAIVGKLARIAALQVDPAAGAAILEAFPYDQQAVIASTGLAVALGEGDLAARLQDLAGFAEECRDIWPAQVKPDAAMAALAREATGFLARQREIAAFLTAPGPLVALCHWNANIDNCWFWRDAEGGLDCGLMDWGHAGQINLAFALWGCLCGAPAVLWTDHLDEIAGHFAAEYRRSSGTALDIPALLLNLRRYVTFMGLGYFLDTPARIRARTSDIRTAWDGLDPEDAADASMRNQIHMLGNVLAVWQRYGLGAQATLA